MRNLELGLTLSIDDKGNVDAKLNSTTEELKKMQRAADGAGDELDDVGASASVVGGSLTRLIPIIASMGAVWAAWEGLQIADKMNVLDQRVRSATRSTGNYAAVSAELFQISQRTGTSLETNVGLFQSLARSSAELGATSGEILTLTELVGQLGIIGGSSAEAMSNGILQFSQAMAAGTVRAEEMNSILDNMPEVAAKIADGMELTVGELQMAVRKGTVLSKDVFETLLKMAPQIAAEMREIPVSLDRATTSLGNTFDKFLQKLDVAIGGSQTLANWLQAASKHLDTLAGDQAAVLEGQLIDQLDELQRLDWAREGTEKQRNFYKGLQAQIRVTRLELAKLEQAAAKSLEIQIEHGKASGNLGGKLGELRGELDGAAGGMGKLGKSTSQATREFEGLIREMNGYRDELNGVTREERAYLDSLDAINLALEQGIIGEQEHAAMLAFKGDQLDEITAKQDAAAMAAIERAEKEKQAAAQAAQAADPWFQAWDRAIKSIDGSFADLWRSAFDGFGNFAESLKNSFRNLLAEMAHAAITRPILIQLGAAGAVGLGGSAGSLGGAGGMLGGGNNMTGIFGSAITKGIGSIFGGGSSGLGSTIAGTGGGGGLLGTGSSSGALAGGIPAAPGGGGMMTGLGMGVGAIGGGLLGGALFDGDSGKTGANIGSSVGAMIGSIWGPPGALIGGALGGLIGGAIGSIFDDKTEPRFQLITQPGHGGFEDDVYADSPFGVTGFGGKSHGVDAGESRGLFNTIADIDTAIAAMIGERATAAIQEFLEGDHGIKGGPGYSSDTFENFSDENFAYAVSERYADLLAQGGTEFTDILSRFANDVEGSTEEVLQAILGFAADLYAVQNAFEKDIGVFGAGDFGLEGLESVNTFLKGFARGGEGLMDVFVRLSDVLAAVTGVAKAFGIALDQSGYALLETTQAVVDAFPGGLDEFKAKTAFFYENFFSPEEQAQDVYDKAREDIIGLNQSLGMDLNTELVDTGEELRNLVEGLDLTTEAGREAFVTAMELAQAIWAQDQAALVLTQDLQLLEAQLGQIPILIDGIGAMLDDSRRQVEMSGLNEEERYDFIKREIDAQMLLLGTASTPEEFAQIAQDINALIMEAWGGISEEQRAALKDEFLVLFDDFESFATLEAEALEARLEMEKRALEAQQEAANKMEIAAAVSQQASQMFASAAREFGSRVQAMPTEVVVRMAASEVG